MPAQVELTADIIAVVLHSANADVQCCCHIPAGQAAREETKDFALARREGVEAGNLLQKSLSLFLAGHQIAGQGRADVEPAVQYGAQAMQHLAGGVLFQQVAGNAEIER